MKCLCCGKDLPSNPSETKKTSGWHRRCIKNFFGTTELPYIELTDEALKLLAEKSVAKEFTVPGVQKKMSLHLSREKKARLTLVDYPTGYILKPQTEDYENLPEFEHMAMLMAEACGIKTVPHALIRMDQTFAYITKRVDRKIKEDTQLFAMEDFCQLSGRLTIDKYKGSYEQCGKIIKKYSSLTGFDLSELFLRIVFSFAIGNSDMHLKNFSLIEDRPGSRIFHLSPAYDMLPVNVILPEDKDQMALTLNGKKRNLRKNDFLKFAEGCGLTKKTAQNLISGITDKKKNLLAICESAFLSDQQKEQMKDIIDARISLLS